MTWHDEILVKQMADQLEHRGPDQQGMYCAEGISLAHRRLSIIDLSENGRQPMANEDGTLWLVFSGEIYNFQELRQELEQKGHHFVSRSDSEVVIHAHEEYGLDAVQRLRGMFAYALYDSKEQRLVLVRDRLGIKPLYYAQCGDNLIFASEIKAILQYAGVKRQVDYQALYDYLGFEFVPAPKTMFSGIHKLPAGHLLIHENKQVRREQYWDLSFAVERRPSFTEAVTCLQEHLDYAVKSHLQADVPLGVFLSGGLDSSCIVALMRRHISGPLKTFTIGYQDATYSELEYADIVARHFQTDHQILYLDSLNADYVEKTLYHLDEPMTDLSVVPLYLLCKQAKEQVTVCLSGEGGDEIFAGYDRFKASRINSYFRFIPSMLRKNTIGALVRRLPDRPQKKGAINMLKRFVEGSELPTDGEHLDMRFMMADSVLMKVDRMSMASALEIRVPFLDHVLVEYLAGLPGDWKLNKLTTKHIFRAALEDLLPREIVYRGKQGYSLPVKHLLRGQLKDYMVERLHDSRLIRECMRVDAIDTLIEEHCSMRQNHNHVLWALLNVAIWHDRFFN